MSHHVPDELLQAFVDGEVDEQVAVHVATHLDACPRCATRATHLEPLGAAFASVDDPPLPDALVDRVMAAALTIPDPRPRLPLVLGPLLLLAATALLVVGTGPTELVFGAAEWAVALPRLGDLAAQVSLSLVGLALAGALFIAGSGVALGLSRRVS